MSILSVSGDIDLSTNVIGDISPLSGLTNLTELYLNNTGNITDLSPLSGLTDLFLLYVRNNAITNVSPLAGLTNLEYLNLAANQYSDISALSGLTNLAFLAINGTADGLPAGDFNGSVTDISALSGMGVLELLWIGDNPISDISVLSQLPSLGRLYAFKNLITDVSALQGAINVTRFNLDRNFDLVDIQPLIDNTGLGLDDNLDLTDTDVSCTDINTLEARGVFVMHNCVASPGGVPRRRSTPTPSTLPEVEDLGERGEDRFRARR